MRFKYHTNWHSSYLGEIVDYCGGGTPSTKNKSYWNGNIPWISSSDLYEDDIYKINKTRFITEQAIQNSATKLCPKESICIVSRVGVGKVAVTQQELCTSQDFFNIIKCNINKYFFAYQIQQKIKIAQQQGTSIKGITSKEIQNFKIWIPSENEQDKISFFLKLIDKRIQTQIKIIDDYISLLNSLRDHLIYTHNSKKATLSGYIDIYNGYTFKSKNYIKDGKYKVITISNVTGQRFVNLASINTINKIPFDIQNYQIIAKDSILVSLTGNVGRTSICNVDNCLLNQRVALVKCKNIDSKYIYHILSSTRFLRKMCLSSQGAAQKNISTKDILDYMIPLHSNQEIKNITRLLEAVESKLDIEKNILNFLYQQKTYLLKNMFI